MDWIRVENRDRGNKRKREEKRDKTKRTDDRGEKGTLSCQSKIRRKQKRKGGTEQQRRKIYG